MKSLLKYILLALVTLTVACTDDPFKELNDSDDWKKERSIISLLVDGQIGTAVITRNGDDAKIKVYAKFENIEDLSKVEIMDMELGYGATSTSTIGSTLDFTTDTSTITVVSGAGESLDWVVTMGAFVSDVEGTWYIGSIEAFFDEFSWESWGKTGIISITDNLPESLPELDNVFTFVVTSSDEEGNPIGTYTHDAGANGEYGVFTDVEKGWNMEERFRNVPTTNGTWKRDFKLSKLILTDDNFQDYEFDLEVNAETGEITIKSPLEYLSSEFDWVNTDWTYEKLAHLSNPMWYALTKERVFQTGNSITAMTVFGQIGDAEINNDDYTINIVVNFDTISDLSQVELLDFSISYAATASVTDGDMLDFSSENSTSIDITSEAGETATYTIQLQSAPQENTSIAGTWIINNIKIHINEFSWESWGKEYDEDLIVLLPESQPELDNIITFTSDGYNAEGNEYGSYTNAVGTDGAHGSFTDSINDWDLTERYRKVPTGSGTWVLDASTDILSITDVNNVVFELLYVIAPDDHINLKSELPYDSGSFQWTDTDWTYEKLFHISNAMWYDLSIQ